MICGRVWRFTWRSGFDATTVAVIRCLLEGERPEETEEDFFGGWENLLQTFRFPTLPISFVSETKSGPCPTLTIRGFLDMVPSLAVIVLQGSFYPWLSLYFSGISSNDLIAFCFALLPSINRSTFNIFSLTLKDLPPLTEQIAKQYRGKSISGWSSAHLHSPPVGRLLASSK